MLYSRILLILLLFSSIKLAAKDDKAILRQYKSTYEFSLNKRTGEPQVRESLEMVFEALRPNAEIVIPSFYDESSSLFSAQVLDAKNKRAVVDKLCGNYEDRDIFYSDTKFCAYKFKISNKGEVARFSSVKDYSNPRYFTSVYFPFPHQIQERIIEFHVPAWITLDLREFNFEGVAIKRSQHQDAKKNVTIIQYTVKDLPAYEEGPLQPGKSYTYPHLLPIIKSYTGANGPTSLLSSTGDLYNWYKGLVNEVKEDHTPYAAKVSELISGKTTDVEKIKAIYYWVQDNIRYIAFEDGIAGFKPESSQKVYQNRFGDCKGMANLTKQMLLQAGYDARLAWIGTRHLAYTYEVPSLAVDNHMVCVLLLGNDTLVLDATEKYIGLYDFAERIQGKELLIEHQEKYLIHSVPQLGANRNQKVKKYRLAIENGTLSGKGNISMQGESRTGILNACNGVRNEGSENLLKRAVVGETKNLQVKRLDYSSLLDRENPFTIDFDFQLDNNLTEYQGEYYFQPNFSADFLALEIKEERLSFMDFKEKIDQHTQVRLALPAGYRVSSRPKDLKIETEEFSFTLTYRVEGKELVFDKRVKIPSGMLTKSSFGEWNSALKTLQQQAKEQIVLSKK